MTNKSVIKNNSNRYAVVVAGGSGTRLWPLSRKDLPKQLQKLVNDKTLIEDTVNRLSGVIPKENIFISTTENYSDKVKELLPEISSENIIIEPIARGTTAAFALFTRIIEKRNPNAIIFSLASDHSVTEVDRFQEAITQSFDFIEKNPKNIALVGIKPDRPDTGLGYIKMSEVIQDKPLAYSVEKFIEKPSFSVAKSYVESGEYFWNSAYYCFKAKAFIEAYDDADENIMKNINAFIESGDIEDYIKIPQKAHEIDLIDSSKYPLSIIPANFKWSDIGNWYTLHKLLSDLSGEKCISNTVNGDHIDINSNDYLVFSTDERMVATVQVENLAIISTPDVLLVLNKNYPQDIKKVIESIKDRGLDKYL